MQGVEFQLVRIISRRHVEPNPAYIEVMMKSTPGQWRPSMQGVEFQLVWPVTKPSFAN